MREWGGDALCSLMQAALKYQHTPPLHDNPKYALFKTLEIIRCLKSLYLKSVNALKIQNLNLFVFFKIDLYNSSFRLQTLLLGPLVELSAIPHADIRSRQLECIMAILHSSAEALTQGKT